MYKYLRIGISSVTPTGDLNKYKINRSTNMYISLLYVRYEKCKDSNK